MGKRAGSRHIPTYRKNVSNRELAFLFCGKVQSFWGLFWGPPAFENRDFLVILTHFRTSAWLAYAPDRAFESWGIPWEALLNPGEFHVGAGASNSDSDLDLT